MSKTQSTSSALRAGTFVVGFLVLVLIGTPLAAEDGDPPAGFHGMLMLGTQGEIYLLHLAMRNAPEHMFQLVMKVELEGSAKTRIGDRTFVGETPELATVGPDQIYFLDRNNPKNGVDVYTFAPTEAFVLSEIADGRRLTFRGDVVRGHFEHKKEGPTAILLDVIVRVRDVVFFQDLRELDANAPSPFAGGQLDFLLFGAGGEHFVTKRITLAGEPGKPDNDAFHQVFPVAAGSERRLVVDASSRAVAVEIEGAESTLLPEEGGVFPARLVGLLEDAPLPLNLELGPEHYREELGVRKKK